MKNIMKKFLSIFVVLTLALCALACDKDKAKEYIDNFIRGLN